jgi:hypothetical protein
MIYKITDNGVIKDGDGANIPNDPDNRHWREYLVWLADGNTPAAADPPPAPVAAPLDAEELYDMLAAKGVVVDADRPRPRAVSGP